MFWFSLGVFIGQNEQLLLLLHLAKPIESEISKLNFREFSQSISLVVVCCVPQRAVFFVHENAFCCSMKNR